MELEVRYLEDLEKETVKVRCKLNTWPDDPDSDGDGYEDNIEKSVYNSDPMKSDVLKIRWDQGYIYIDVEGKTTLKDYTFDGYPVGYGGWQMWKENEYNHTASDIELWISNRGCGLISAADVLLYLSSHRSGYNTVLTRMVQYTDKGFYEYESYFEYLIKLHNNLYFPASEIGVLPVSIVNGINKYAKDCGVKLNATWMAPSKTSIMNGIKSMLANDIPVPLLIGPPKDLETCWIKMYQNIGSEEYARNHLSNYVTTEWHYVTVTGLLEDRIQNDIILEVSSWGQRYYISYNEYIDYVLNYSMGGHFISSICYISTD